MKCCKRLTHQIHFYITRNQKSRNLTPQQKFSSARMKQTVATKPSHILRLFMTGTTKSQKIILSLYTHILPHGINQISKKMLKIQRKPNISEKLDDGHKTVRLTT